MNHLNLLVVDEEIAIDLFTVQLYLLTPTNDSSFVSANLNYKNQFGSINSRMVQSRISSSLNLGKGWTWHKIYLIQEKSGF